jgi:26S proteasome regulatory subunit N1
MTSVPKPLKFLRPFYNELISLSEKWNTDELEKERALCCSIISVLAMTYSDNGQRDTLHYRITSGSKEAPGDWGNEYVRHLASEIGEEYSLAINGEVGVTEPTQEPVKPTPKSADAMAVDDSEKVVTGGTESTPAAVTAQQKVVRPLKSRDQLLSLALELVPFFLQHNAEADAVDLLLELESIESLATDEFLNKETGEAIYSRVCQYMVS